jgi:hypothetical protein
MYLEKKVVDYDVIKDITWCIECDKVVLRWFWPFQIKSVYIVKSRRAEDLNFDNVNFNNSRIYTRDEYKSRESYQQPTGIGEFLYGIFPVIEEDGQNVLIDQKSGANRVCVSERKIDILYNVIERRKLFSSFKEVTIAFSTSIMLDRSTLCYVKKKDCLPCTIDDGLRYNFSRNISNTSDRFTNITVKKNEFVDVFLTTEDYVKTYNLIRSKGVL